MKVATVIVAWNGATHLPACLESLVGQEPSCDIVVVDNASTDDTVPIVRSFAGRAPGRCELLQSDENVGFTRGANLGLRPLLERGEHELIVLLNQDVQLLPGCLAQMVALVRRTPRTGAVGAKTLFPDRRTLQHAGGYVEQPRLVGLHHGHHQLDEGAYDTDRDVDFVTGAVMALRVDALKEVGIFDEIFSPGYYEDVELCARLRAAGWRVLYCAEAVAEHAESASFRDPFERQVLNHRNRLFYALPSLREAQFAARFVAAERAAFVAEPSLDGLRALAAAYLQALLRIDEVARARESGSRCARRELVQIFATLRDDCLAQLHRRRIQD